MTEPKVDPTLTCSGPYGVSERVPLPSSAHNADLTTCLYLITAPLYHPAWSQYVLSVVDLVTEKPGMPPANLHFPGATHELLVMAIDPSKRDGRFSPITLIEYFTSGQRGLYLSPVNIGHQFAATEEEMTNLAWLCGRAVILGQLNPETGDAPELIRESWLAACVQTLAHQRGEVHGDLEQGGCG